MLIDTVIIFAAGFGTRMRDLTSDTTPKPLVKILGKPFLHHVLELCVHAKKFNRIIINTHYMADLVKESVKNFEKSFMGKSDLPEINVIYENPIKETGGAIKNSRKLIENCEYIFTINSDSIIRSEKCIFKSMNDCLGDKMDFLLLLSDKESVIGQKAGDFNMHENGKLCIDNKPEDRLFTYTGVQIMKPSLAFENNKDVFPVSEIQKSSDKVYGVIHDGLFFHANSKQHIQQIEQYCGF